MSQPSAAAPLALAEPSAPDRSERLASADPFLVSFANGLAALLEREACGGLAANDRSSVDEPAREALAALGPDFDRVARSLVRAVAAVQRDAGHVQAGSAGLDATADDRSARRSAADGASDAAPTLTLIDPARIDEDIALTGATQAIEARCEDTHRAALARTFRAAAPDAGLPSRALPASPSDVVTGLRRGLAELGVGRTVRLALIRELAVPLGELLDAHYADRVGVAPSYAEPSGAPAPHAPDVESFADTEPEPVEPPEGATDGLDAPHTREAAASQAALDRVVRWTRSITTDVATEDASAHNALPARQATQVMSRLFDHFERQGTLVREARVILQRLHECALSLAARDASLWLGPQHPWWHLLDRIVTHGTLDEQHPAARCAQKMSAIAGVVADLQRVVRIDRTHCQTAVSEIDRVVSQLRTRRRESSSSGAASAQAAGLSEQRERWQDELRNQVVQQLRLNPAPAALREFLVGAWTVVLGDGASRFGVGSQAFEQLASLVDELLQACARPGEPIGDVHRHTLVQRARRGLADCGGLSGHRIDAELDRLEEVLQCPPPAMPESWEEPPVTAPLPDVATLVEPGPGSLPADVTPANSPSTSSADWLESLQPGSWCRLYMLGRWTTAQLTWVSDKRSMFLFESRRGGRNHSMTRRVLERMHGAGLASTLEPGQAHAPDTDTIRDTLPTEPL